MMDRPQAGEREPAGAAASRVDFDKYVENYTRLHGRNIRMSGEPPEYFAEYKVKYLERCRASFDEPLLDFGCGIGNGTTKIAEVFRDVHGYDPSAESLSAAAERLDGVRFYTRVDDIPKGHFATAVMSGVLHHVPLEERHSVLMQVLGTLRPGGRLFVFEHNPLNPLTRHAVATCPWDDDAVLLWPLSARKLLRAAGLRILQLDYIVFFPRWLDGLRRFEPWLRRVCLGAQYVIVADAGYGESEWGTGE